MRKIVGAQQLTDIIQSQLANLTAEDTTHHTTHSLTGTVTLTARKGREEQALCKVTAIHLQRRIFFAVLTIIIDPWQCIRCRDRQTNTKLTVAN